LEDLFPTAASLFQLSDDWLSAISYIFAAGVLWIRISHIVFLLPAETDISQFKERVPFIVKNELSEAQY
jgi:hypothetical protein